MQPWSSGDPRYVALCLLHWMQNLSVGVKSARQLFIPVIMVRMDQIWPQLMEMAGFCGCTLQRLDVTVVQSLVLFAWIGVLVCGCTALSDQTTSNFASCKFEAQGYLNGTPCALALSSLCIFCFWCFKLVHVQFISTGMSGKGHRKLRLCSRKHYERVKYKHRHAAVFMVSIPLELLQFRVSIPLSFVESAKAQTTDTLHKRLVHTESLSPRGTQSTVYYYTVFMYTYTWFNVRTNVHVAIQFFSGVAHMLVCI